MINVMKPKRKLKKLRITVVDFMLANRRAARMEEISEHGRPVSMRSAFHGAGLLVAMPCRPAGKDYQAGQYK